MKDKCSVRPPFLSSSVKSGMNQGALVQKPKKDFSESVKTSIRNQPSSSTMKEKCPVRPPFLSSSVKSSFIGMNQNVLVQKPRKDFSQRVNSSIRNQPSSSITKGKSSKRPNFHPSSVKSSFLARNVSVSVCKPERKLSESVKNSSSQPSSPVKKGKVSTSKKPAFLSSSVKSTKPGFLSSSVKSTKPGFLSSSVKSTKQGFLSSSVKSSFFPRSQSVSQATFKKNKAECTTSAVLGRKNMFSKSSDCRKVPIQKESIFNRKVDDLSENSISNSLVHNMPFEEVVASPKETKLGPQVEVDASLSSDHSLVGIDHSIGGDKVNDNDISEATEGEISEILAIDDCRVDENKISEASKDGSPSPQISARLKDISNALRDLHSHHNPSSLNSPIQNLCLSNVDACNEIVEPRTPLRIMNTSSQTCMVEPKTPEPSGISIMNSPCWQTFSARSIGILSNMTQDYITFLNYAKKEELMKIKGIGEKRASYIVELRRLSPEPFKNLDDLKRIGLSTKQVTGMMKHVAGDVFNEKEMEGKCSANASIASPP